MTMDGLAGEWVNGRTGFRLFSKYQIPGFLKVFGPKFQIFQDFLCQIPGIFIQILVIKILKCVKTDACSHFSCDTKFHILSRLFPGKRNEIKGQFGFESVFVLIM